MSTRKRVLGKRLSLFLGLALLVGLPATGLPATFTVNSTVDAVDAGIDGVCQTAAGQCTLRAAIQEANASVGVADTITLPAGTYALTIVGADENAAATGDLDLVNAGNVTITGAGAATTIIDGAAITDGVFETLVTANVTMSGVTIRNGNTTNGNGGGIHVGNGTTMGLTNAVVTNCTAGGGAPGAGGIDNSGTLNMNTVSVLNNNSPGGAINNGAAGVLTLLNGTVGNNLGGGINNSGGIMGLTNVTVSGNSTAENGAGIDNRGNLTLQNVTISGNTSTTALNIGGLRNDNAQGGVATLRNTIVSGNLPANCGGTITSQGNNLDNGITCGLIGAGDASSTDPLLVALAANGGSVMTQALTAGSPAIDTGTAAGCPATDARAIARPVDGNIPPDGTVTCDKGAFEFRPQTIVATPAASVDFGTVTSGTTADQVITLANTGDGALILGTLAAADPLAAPFTILADTCSGQTLARAGTCTLTLRFSPVSTNPATDTFSIPSNDPNPLRTTLAFSLAGTGTATIVPNIAVTDSVAPANDLQTAFGAMAVGATADATITVTNTGTANLVLGAVAGANPLAAPFTIVTDNCSNTTLAPTGGSCLLSVRFTPTDNAASSDSFDIPSNDPDTPTLAISLSGSGVSVAGNNPPSAIALGSPANGQTGLGTTVTFSWTRAVDPDGGTVSYQLFNCPDQSFAGCPPVNVSAAGSAGLAFAGMGGMSAGLIMIGFVMEGGFLRRTRRAMLAIAVLLLMGSILISCGGGGDDSPAAPPADQVTQTLSGLAPGTTYYWKVVAGDGQGGTSTSETRSYTTQ